MIKYFQLILCFFFVSFTIELIAQTIWNGPIMTFTKPGFSDPTLEENQDRITDNVWITRANTQGLFNAKTESNYNGEDSPADTEWAEGTTTDIASLSFSPWVDAVAANPPGNLNKNFVLHLITDDIYIDIIFTQWGQGSGSGGSFKYTRSTDSSTSLEYFANAMGHIVYPNPSQDFIRIKGDIVLKRFRIFEADTGILIKKGTVDNDQRIDVKGLENGNYILVNESNRIVLKFVKVGS